jgi:hypothetical protein
MFLAKRNSVRTSTVFTWFSIVWLVHVPKTRTKNLLERISL